MVPGVFDMPLAIKILVKDKTIDAVVTVGAVIEGETEHDKIVIGQAARKMTDLAVEYEKPVGLGISGPRDEQAPGGGPDRARQGRGRVAS